MRYRLLDNITDEIQEGELTVGQDIHLNCNTISVEVAPNLWLNVWVSEWGGAELQNHPARPDGDDGD